MSNSLDDVRKRLDELPVSDLKYLQTYLQVQIECRERVDKLQKEKEELLKKYQKAEEKYTRAMEILDIVERNGWYLSVTKYDIPTIKCLPLPLYLKVEQRLDGTWRVVDLSKHQKDWFTFLHYDYRPADDDAWILTDDREDRYERGVMTVYLYFKPQNLESLGIRRNTKFECISRRGDVIEFRWKDDGPVCLKNPDLEWDEDYYILPNSVKISFEN